MAKEYLDFLLKIYEDHGIANETLLFTSDGAYNGNRGTIPEKLLMTANFQGDVDTNFGKLKEMQPDKPVMAMEFWSGWLALFAFLRINIPSDSYTIFHIIYFIITGSIIGLKIIMFSARVVSQQESKFWSN